MYRTLRLRHLPAVAIGGGGVHRLARHEPGSDGFVL